MQCLTKEKNLLSTTLTQICTDSTKLRRGKVSTPIINSDYNDPFIVCLKEKSNYFYDSLVNENKYPLNKSASEDNFPEDRPLQLQYVAEIVNSGSCQRSLKSPTNTSTSNKKIYKDQKPLTQYNKRVSVNPFETGNIEEEAGDEEDDAVRFICESGILGSPVEIMGNAISGIFRKQSKVTTTFQEPVNKEQVRSEILCTLMCQFHVIFIKREREESSERLVESVCEIIGETLAHFCLGVLLNKENFCLARGKYQ